MQYRVLRPLSFNRSGTVNEIVEVQVGTLLDPCPLDTLHWRDQKGIRGQMERAEPEKLVVFQWEGGPRTAVIGKDVSGISNTMRNWKR